MEQSPAHAEAWQETLLLFGELRDPARAVYQRLKSARQYPFDNDTRLQAEDVSSTRKWRPLVATAALLISAVAITLRGPVNLQDLRSDFHTASGDQQHVTLADGSRILLNTDTAIAVDISDSERHVELLRGEAFFEVIQDRQRPFMVDSGDTLTQVTGTAFSVAKLKELTTVTVETGRVEVAGGKTTLDRAALSAGQSVRYLEERFSDIQPVVLTEALAWRQGRIIFQQEPLTKVIEQVNRYRPGRLVIFDPAIRDRLVTGVFEIDHLGQIPDTLERTLGIEATRLTHYLILLH